MRADKILATAKSLTKHKKFELPYGRAWFVLLLDEMQHPDHHRADTVTLHVFQRALALQVLDELQSSHDNGGLHDSWLFSAFLLGRAKHLDADVDFRYRALLARRTQRLENDVKSDTAEDMAFFKPKVIAQILLNQPSFTLTPGDFNAFSRRVHLEGSSVDPVEGHISGFFQTQLWPGALIAAEGDHAACDRFVAIFDRFTSDPLLWKTDFSARAHWVPQFMTMSIWLALGQP